MRIANLYGCGRPVFSFEFFPPNTSAGESALFRALTALKVLRPDFVSMTSHARGENRARMIQLVGRIQRELGITAMGHVPCSGQKRAVLHQALQQLAAQGVENLMALGGDPGRAESAESAEGARRDPDAFYYGADLAAHAREHFRFSIGGGCYPEKHPRAPDFAADLRHLKHKVESGAEVLFTQLFLENAHYFRFVERARAAGIHAPIVPGIMPMVSAQNLQRALSYAPGSETPAELQTQLQAAAGDAQQSLAVGVAWAAKQCRELLAGGAPGIHFYTLNKSPAALRVRQQLEAEL